MIYFVILATGYWLLATGYWLLAKFTKVKGQGTKNILLVSARRPVSDHIEDHPVSSIFATQKVIQHLTSSIQ